MADRRESGSKAEEAAGILNRTLQELIIRCGREEGVRDYFEVGVIGYGDHQSRNALEATLGPEALHPISKFEANPLKVENRSKRVPDGAGGLTEIQISFPIWFEPRASDGTPMRDALAKAAEAVAEWSDAHPQSFPPVIIHLTDGESTDGDPEPIADKLKLIATGDGEVVLMNVFVSSASGLKSIYPSSPDGLPNDYARMLFRMSSPLVGKMVDHAKSLGYAIDEGARAFVFNADNEQLVDFFDIGTRGANMR
jgi:hypothetical protein